MGCSSGPDIVEDGLVLCLDAGSKRSYPGTGTTWYDTSGNDNHFTLYNTPTFSSDNGGCISFNGTDEYARSTNTIDLSHDGSYVVEAICKVSNSQSSFLWELSANWNTNSGGCGLALHNNGASYSSGKCHLNHSSRNGPKTLNMPTENMKWNMFNQLLSSNTDSTGTLMYINTELKDFVSINGYTTTKTSNNYSSVGRDDYIWLGARNGVTLPMLGSIASFKIYKNNKLTTQEVRKNYLSTKERYQ